VLDVGGDCKGRGCPLNLALRRVPLPRRQYSQGLCEREDIGCFAISRDGGVQHFGGDKKCRSKPLSLGRYSGLAIKIDQAKVTDGPAAVEFEEIIWFDVSVRVTYGVHGGQRLSNFEARLNDLFELRVLAEGDSERCCKSHHDPWRIGIRWLLWSIEIEQWDHSWNPLTAPHPVDFVLEPLVSLPGPQMRHQDLDCPLLVCSRRPVNKPVASGTEAFMYGPTLKLLSFPSSLSAKYRP